MMQNICFAHRVICVIIMLRFLALSKNTIM